MEKKIIEALGTMQFEIFRLQFLLEQKEQELQQLKEIMNTEVKPE